MEDNNIKKIYIFRIFIAQLILFLITTPLIYITMFSGVGRGYVLLIYIAWLILYLVYHMKFNRDFTSSPKGIVDYGNKYLFLFGGLGCFVITFLYINGMFPYETIEEIKLSSEYNLSGIVSIICYTVIILSNLIIDILRFKDTEKNGLIKTCVLIILFLGYTIIYLTVKSNNSFMFLLMIGLLVIVLGIIIYKDIQKNINMNQIYNKIFFVTILSILIIGMIINFTELYAVF